MDQSAITEIPSFARITAKLDGVFAVWTGEEIVLKSGKICNLPDLVADLKAYQVAAGTTGELWHECMTFDQINTIVRASLTLREGGVKFAIHSPRYKGITGGLVMRCPILNGTPQECYENALSQGFEGIVAEWENRQVKVKPHYDFEARLIRHHGTRGEFATDSGVTFSAAINRPMITGMTATIKCAGLFPKSGKPRFPVIEKVAPCDR